MATFLGLAYPITSDPQGYFRIQTDIELIKGDIVSLLMTNPGERVMEPTFGTGLRKFLFDQNDNTLRESVREKIIRSIETWEPRIAVEQIQVLVGTDTADISTSLDPNDDRSNLDDILLVRILFADKSNVTEVQELRLEIPLGTLV